MFDNINPVTLSFMHWSNHFITVTSLSSVYTTCSWIYKWSILLQVSHPRCVLRKNGWVCQNTTVI